MCLNELDIFSDTNQAIMQKSLECLKKIYQDSNYN